MLSLRRPLITVSALSLFVTAVEKSHPWARPLQIKAPKMLSPAWRLRVLAAGAVLGLLAAVDAATVTHDFNVTWVTSNPDGLFERPTIGINGQWPVPQITAAVGDNVEIRVHNLLGNARRRGRDEEVVLLK